MERLAKFPQVKEYFAKQEKRQIYRIVKNKSKYKGHKSVSVLNAGSSSGECIYIYVHLRCTETFKFHILYADSRFFFLVLFVKLRKAAISFVVSVCTSCCIEPFGSP